MSLVFGNAAGTLLTVFVIVSCLGTLNGLIMGSARGMFAIAMRGMGPRPDLFRKLNPTTNATTHSALLGYALSCAWLLVWYGNFAGWWGEFMDVSELPIAFLYVIYIAMYYWVMKTLTDLDGFSRFVCPLLAGGRVGLHHLGSRAQGHVPYVPGRFRLHPGCGAPFIRPRSR